MPIQFESSRLAEKEHHFREFSVWPNHSALDTDSWLKNFSCSERKIAERLLTNFTFFNEKMTDALLRSAVQRYFSIAAKNAYAGTPNVDDFIRETAFVICEGETPRPTDSGHIFARKLRDQINIPEDQIFSPSSALKQRSLFKHFIFVDDFAGSGSQFTRTWQTTHYIDGKQMSFDDLTSQPKGAFVYCCCIATTKAREALERATPRVVLCPAHELTEENNAVTVNSRIWEGMDASAAIQVIKTASARAGYEAEDCGQEDWRGFRCLGLTLAFNHGIPDASLPIFFSQRNNWRPLIARSAHD